MVTRAEAEARLRGAVWLQRPEVQQILELLDGVAGRTRAVGGIVRDALLGLERDTNDVDMATELLPEEVVRRAVRGSLEAIGEVLRRTGTGTGINTAYIERLNATFRARLPGLVRRGRALLHEEGRMGRWMYLVGCLYNFCWSHDSLRLRAEGAGRKWWERTPAMAGGLADHIWGVQEVMATPLPPQELSSPSQ